MSEAEILSQIQTARYNISFVVSIIITAQFALIVAIYYFLNQARWPLQVGVFAIYTASLAALLSLYAWEIAHVVAAYDALRDLATPGPVSRELLSWSSGPLDVQSWLPWVVFLIGWLGIAFFLFVYRIQVPPAKA